MGAVLLLAAPLPATASERSESPRRAADYLVGHQAPDGTFFGDDASHRVAETLVALVAGGVTGAPVSRALAAVESDGPQAADRAGEAGLLVMGVVAAGRDPRAYVEHLRTFYDETLGAYDTQQFQNALALLGVVAADERIPDGAVTFLRLNRCPDGGIPVQVPCGGAGGHVDVTALVLQALVRDGMPASDSLRADARSFLVAAQNAEGGFGDTKGASTNANSTGLVLGALAALGESPTDAPWRDPLRVLLALQQPDGRFRQGKAAEGDSYLATRQAIPGVAGRPYPVQPTPQQSPPATAAATSTSTTTSTTVGSARLSAPSRSVGTSSTTPAQPTTLALRRNPTPERVISPQNAGEGREEAPVRSRPVGLAAIAAALLFAVAWKGARLPRPRGDHASPP